MNNIKDKYEHLTLVELAEKLHLDYYDIIRNLVDVATENLQELKRLDINRLTAGYTNVCSILLQKICAYLDYRNQALLPYINELHFKDTTGHNCAACSGSCDMGHAMHLASLRESQLGLATLLHELQLNVFPLYKSFEYSTLYHKLRNEMYLLDIILRELLFIEESKLMTGIVKAQKKINVYR